MRMGFSMSDAENSNLTDVLFAISEKTGAGIELPMSEGMLDRVVMHGWGRDARERYLQRCSKVPLTTM